MLTVSNTTYVSSLERLRYYLVSQIGDLLKSLAGTVTATSVTSLIAGVTGAEVIQECVVFHPNLTVLKVLISKSIDHL